MSTPEDQVTPDAQPQSALSALSSPELRDQARAYADKYFKSQLSGENTRGEEAVFQQQAADDAQAREALRQAREKLAARRMDPSILGLRFAQAMMAPSRYGIQDQWGNAMGAVADWRQQNQAFQQQQDTQDLSLQEKLAGVDQQSLKSRLALEELREKTGAQTADTALKLLGKPLNPKAAESPVGKMVEDKLGVGSLQTTAGQALFDKYLLQSRQSKLPAGTDIPQELQDAIDERRLDPSRLNSRTVGIYAQLARNNPQFNFNEAISQAALQKNAAFEQRAMSMETLPEVMKSMTDLGKKVGYDDIKFAGRAQKWFKGETNDPDLTKYMTVRNDALMNIASVMRGVGMSDKAHEAEVEAASATMSPKALDAWLEGQMLALGPRLKNVQRVSHLGDPTFSGAASTTTTPPGKAVSLDDYLKKQGY